MGTLHTILTARLPDAVALKMLKREPARGLSMQIPPNDLKDCKNVVEEKIRREIHWIRRSFLVEVDLPLLNTGTQGYREKELRPQVRKIITKFQ